MKNQNTGSNRPAAGNSSLRGMAMWGLCLGGIGMAIAANTAREAKNPLATTTVTASPVSTISEVRSAPAQPLTREYQPSANFPGVMVRHIPSNNGAQGAPKSGGGAASVYKWAGANSNGLGTRSSGNGYTTGSTRSVKAPIERKVPGGGASLRFDRSLYSRAGMQADGKGGYRYECVDDRTLGAGHTHAPGESHRPVAGAQKAPAKTAVTTP